MSKDKSTINLFKTTWDSFNYRVTNELALAKDNDVDTNRLRYKDFMEHLVKYRSHLIEINDSFQRPHKIFFNGMLKKFSKLEQKIKFVYNPLIAQEQENN